MRRAFSADPTPAASPCPSDPVARSTHGSRGVGCPSRSLVSSRSVSVDSRETMPTSAQAAYSSGAACPLERMKRSLSGRSASVGSYRISPQNRTATTSAAEQQVLGWPLPAFVVLRTESIRRRVATLRRAAVAGATDGDTRTSGARSLPRGRDDSGPSRAHATRARQGRRRRPRPPPRRWSRAGCDEPARPPSRPRETAGAAGGRPRRCRSADGGHRRGAPPGRPRPAPPRDRPARPTGAAAGRASCAPVLPRGRDRRRRHARRRRPAGHAPAAWRRRGASARGPARPRGHGRRQTRGHTPPVPALRGRRWPAARTRADPARRRPRAAPGTPGRWHRRARRDSRPSRDASGRRDDGTSGGRARDVRGALTQVGSGLEPDRARQRAGPVGLVLEPGHGGPVARRPGRQ